MDIVKLVEALSQEEKDHLIKILTNGKILTATDTGDKTPREVFIRNNPDMSVRLRNILRSYGKGGIDFKEDITKELFFKQRNAGKKTWDELQRYM